jgi:hypothetical protein
MLRSGDFVITYVSEELSVSFIRVTRIGELGTTLAVTSNHLIFLRSLCRLLVTANVVPSSPILILMKEALRSYETRFLQEPHGVTSKKTQFFNIILMTSRKKIHFGAMFFGHSV